MSSIGQKDVNGVTRLVLEISKIHEESKKNKEKVIVSEMSYDEAEELLRYIIKS